MPGEETEVPALTLAEIARKDVEKTEDAKVLGAIDEVLAAANPTEQLSKAELLKLISDLREENATLRTISEKWGMCLITLHRLLGDRQRVAMMGVMAAAQAFNIVEAVLKSAEEEAKKLMKKKEAEEPSGG